MQIGPKMRVISTPILLSILTSCTSFHASDSQFFGGVKVEFSDIKDRRINLSDISDLISIKGKVFIAGEKAVLLTKISYQLPEGQKVPEPEECIHVLVSNNQYKKMYKLSPRKMHLQANLIYFNIDNTDLYPSVSVKGRSTQLYCQYNTGSVPVLYLKEWRIE